MRSIFWYSSFIDIFNEILLNEELSLQNHIKPCLQTTWRKFIDAFIRFTTPLFSQRDGITGNFLYFSVLLGVFHISLSTCNFDKCDLFSWKVKLNVNLLLIHTPLQMFFFFINFWVFSTDEAVLLQSKWRRNKNHRCRCQVLSSQPEQARAGPASAEISRVKRGSLILKCLGKGAWSRGVHPGCTLEPPGCF